MGEEKNGNSGRIEDRLRTKKHLTTRTHIQRLPFTIGDTQSLAAHNATLPSTTQVASSLTGTIPLPLYGDSGIWITVRYWDA